MTFSKPVFFALGLAATVAVANAGSHADPVEARMQLMKTISAQAKILGTAAKGDFDAAAVSAAANTLHESALAIPATFEPNATRADSEALPVIWKDFKGFTAKAGGLQAAAKTAMAATDVASLGAAMGEVGEACKACHSNYRE